MTKPSFWWLAELYKDKARLKASEIELAWQNLSQGESAPELESACECLSKLSVEFFDLSGRHKFGLGKPRNLVRLALLYPMLIPHYFNLANPNGVVPEKKADLLMFEHALRFVINLVWRQARGYDCEQT
ncbi:MAG TPA: hypothetical protein H9850_04985 [Candidatus Anaerobiospirillum pullistercoris]|uniref:Uncharacterized protein n=1 Tax=Candidatus Anaerobiospirillum pullistercoris TaxID=2838452 RepID=A0A9D1WDA9_9GAMM|nr:hypothetical protein [Candidatus Anaerobiospirillum pullistercoris]